jgi:hypothetical protein
MIDTVTFRSAEPADIPQLVALMNSQYVRKKTEAYFRWQFFESVFPTELMCAFREGLLLGMFGLQRRMTADGMPFGQAIDLLVSPELRGMGVFAELGRRALAQYPDLKALCVLPNLNGRNACVKSLGWDAIAKIDALILDSPVLLKRGKNAGHSDSQNLPPFRFDWNNSIRKWRFDRHPDYRYEMLAGESDSSACIKLFTDPVTGRGFGDIVEFSCCRDNAAVVLDLFSAASRRLFSLGAKCVTTWALPHTMLFQILTHAGFRPVQQERYFCVKALDPGMKAVHDITQWHLVQADAELF